MQFCAQHQSPEMEVNHVSHRVPTEGYHFVPASIKPVSDCWAFKLYYDHLCMISKNKVLFAI